MNMKRLLAISGLLIVLMVLLIGYALREAKILFNEHSSVADRVAACIIKEYESDSERKSVQNYCEAKIRIENENE
jgi:hypothetical protein